MPRQKIPAVTRHTAPHAKIATLGPAPSAKAPAAEKTFHNLPEKFTPYRFTMSVTFPVPDLPRDNPLIEERVALGKAPIRD